MRLDPRPYVHALILAAVVAAPAAAQQKPTLKPEDYGRFETAGFAQLSPNGQWLAVPVSRVNEENELRLLKTDSDSAVVVAYGSQAAFSKDGRWAVRLVGAETFIAGLRGELPSCVTNGWIVCLIHIMASRAVSR